MLRLLQLPQDLLTGLGWCAADHLLGEELGGATQLLGGVRAGQLDDPVLHLTIVEHKHDEHAVVREPDELEVGEPRQLRTRHGDHAREPCQVGEQLRGVGEQGFRITAWRHIDVAA